MLSLLDIRDALRSRLVSARSVLCNVAAFAGWITSDTDRLLTAVDEAVRFTGQARHPEHIAALGYGAHAATLSEAHPQILRDEIEHLGGRTFFPPGRTPRFEIDGIALLGVALGAARLFQSDDIGWLTSLLVRSSNEVRSDSWQLGLVRLARLALGDQELRIVPPDLAVAAASRGLGGVQTNDREQAWKMVTELSGHECGIARDAARLAVFEH